MMFRKLTTLKTHTSDAMGEDRDIKFKEKVVPWLFPKKFGQISWRNPRIDIFCQTTRKHPDVVELWVGGFLFLGKVEKENKGVYNRASKNLPKISLDF